MKKHLRPYQQQAIDHALRRLREGYLRMYITLPTGTGKSVILTALAAHLLQTGRILVLVHRQDIAKQLFREFEEEELEVGLLMQGHRILAAPIVVTMTQSLTTLALQDLLCTSETPIAAIFIDEAHHAVKGSDYERIVTEIEHISPRSPIPVIGFTATPYRSDKQSMLSFLPTCVFARDIPDMIRDQYLSPLVWKPLHVDIDLSKVRINTQGEEDDYSEDALASELGQVAITKDIARLVASYIQQRPTLVFAVSIEHAEKLAHAFCQLGYSAQAISGKQTRAEREQLFADWRRGAVQIVCNCSLLTEGFDFPEISAVVIARPTRSPSLYTQMIGRGTRPAKGKKDCLILDVMGNNPDPRQQIVLPHIVGDTQVKGSHGSSTSRVTTDPLLKRIYGTDKPSLSLLDPIGQSRYRWLPYRLKNFEGYLAVVGQYERAIIERDTDGSGLYRSRLYKIQPEQVAQDIWIEHQYLPLRQQVALVHEATNDRYREVLSGKEAKWLHQHATKKQLQTLERMHPQAAQQARAEAWTGQKISDIITFLPMIWTLTHPPLIPQKEGSSNVV